MKKQDAIIPVASGKMQPVKREVENTTGTVKLSYQPDKIVSGGFFLDAQNTQIIQVIHDEGEKMYQMYKVDEQGERVGRGSIYGTDDWADVEDLRTRSGWNYLGTDLKGRLAILQALAQQLIAGNLKAGFEGAQIQSGGSEEGLVKVGSQQHLDALHGQLEDRKALIESVQGWLALQTNKLRLMVYQLQEKITAIMKIVAEIETYLGTKETIWQIAEGEPAPVDEILYYRREIRYMDEVLGRWQQEEGDPYGIWGLDFRSIDEFDAWLADPVNLEAACPEAKCVVAYRITRQHRHYSNDPLIQSAMQSKNKATYLLIRNGFKVYRIWSEHVVFGKALFPSDQELAQVREGLGTSSFESYRRNAFLLQGLMDRTTLLQPLPGHCNLIMDEAPPWIRTVNDHDMMLPLDHPLFEDWKKAINATLKRGSRVHIAPSIAREFGYDRENSDYRYTRLQRWYPEVPTSGIYEIQYVDKDASYPLVIYYNPGDEVYDARKWVESESQPGWGFYGEYRQRKKRIGFRLAASDDFVLAYDQLTPEELTWYIEDYHHRRDYLEVLPLLCTLKAVLEKEREHENHFIRLMMDQTGASEAMVKDCVQWWKLKNIWKRPIAKDDAKAMRMIEREIHKRTPTT